MRDTPLHLRTLEEIEEAGILGPSWRCCARRAQTANRTTEEKQKRRGWEMAVRIEKIIAAVLDEAHKRQVE